MKSFILFFSIFFLLFRNNSVIAQKHSESHKMKINMIVDASCSKCQFNKDDDTCLLAIKLNSEIFYVEGTSIDDHGDAHGTTGFCNVIRKAHVIGEISENRFLLERFSLLRYRPKKKLYTD